MSKLTITITLAIFLVGCQSPSLFAQSKETTETATSEALENTKQETDSQEEAVQENDAVENHEAGRTTNEPAAEASPDPAPFSGIPGRADVLLITSDELAASWTEFANWKTATGRPTKIVAISQIDSEYQGEDIQQKIRDCCLEHIEAVSYTHLTLPTILLV